MKRIAKILSYTIIILASLSLFAWSVKHVSQGGKRLGAFSKSISLLADFPSTIETVLKSKELRNIPNTYVVADTSFKQINKLDYDLYILNSRFDNKSKTAWNIELINIRNDSNIYNWKVFKKDLDLSKTKRTFKAIGPKHSLILPHKNLILNGNQAYNLLRIDSLSHIKWINNEKLFHHSIEQNKEGNIWICSNEPRGIRAYRKNKIIRYTDDCVTLIDTETGEIIFDKSIIDILRDNGHLEYAYCFGHIQSNKRLDPIHLNDIQPALHDGPYWLEGDIFISCRRLNLIILYRPSTNKVLRLITGPFIAQHDVDILSDTSIAICNNNIHTNQADCLFEDDTEETQIDSIGYSNIIRYDFKNNVFDTLFQSQMNDEKVILHSQGLYQILSNGDLFLEDQNYGELRIMNNDTVLLRKSFNTDIKNMVEKTNWIRIYEDLKVLQQ